MRKFIDSAGREWAVTIDVTVRSRVLKDTDFDLFSVLEEGAIDKLNDPVTLVAVVHSLCADDVAKLNLTPEQFARGMTGDALDAAAEALMGAIADFFPKRQREVMNRALAKGTQIADRSMELALQKIDQLDVTADRSSVSSGSSPALPESIPAAAD